jgi:hypothetical protein
MRHHLDTPISSDLSAEVLKRRKLIGDLDLQGGETLERLFNVPSLIAARRRFIPDVELGSDEHVMDITLGHYRPAQRKG